MPASKPVRRAQLISPFGVGAITNFPGDESLMTAGLDAWAFAREECPPDWKISEERLQKRLGVEHLRLPPDYQEHGEGVDHPYEVIPYVRFPRWHYCPQCGFMSHIPLFQLKPDRCSGPEFGQGMDCSSKPEKRRPRLIPMRILAACGAGHIQDFPFMEWVHRDSSPRETCTLRFRAGRSSASLSGIKISCTCGEEQSLGGVFSEGALHRTIGYECQENQPWLGIQRGDRSLCVQRLRVVQRGASNVYFPQVVGSIYLPLWAEDTDSSVVRALENPVVWGPLSTGLIEGKYVDPSRVSMVAEIMHLGAEELAAAAQRKLDGLPAETSTKAEESYRYQEYVALRDERGGKDTELYVQSRSIEQYTGTVSRLFTRICLVRKLRETRALAGFTRIDPPDGDLGSNRLQPLSSGIGIEWLPAMIVRGEGIFLEFNYDRIVKWSSDEAGSYSRIRPLLENYEKSRAVRGQAPRNINAKFVMMHTFAHMLINQLAFDCGYGSASLRERIYCNFDEESEEMQGILIYTASGDSEGTMGGLVRQGEPDRLPFVLDRALRRAQWCSADPVCIESKGQGTDNANLAACHACVLLSETSCEEGNRLLDRAAVIGTPHSPDGGFASLDLHKSTGSSSGS